MKRIGILGGTFNPVHIGHLLMAQMAQEKFALSRVVFVPCYDPPHKRIRNLAKPRDRYELAKLAISNNPLFDVSDYEVRKGGKSYSIETIRYMREKFGMGVKLYFIIGGDGQAQLSTWKDIDQLCKLVTFIVVNRPGFELKKGKIPYQSVIMPGIDVSASYLRRRIQRGQSIQYLVPDPVVLYIQKHQLYRDKLIEE